MSYKNKLYSWWRYSITKSKYSSIIHRSFISKRQIYLTLQNNQKELWTACLIVKKVGYYIFFSVMAAYKNELKSQSVVQSTSLKQFGKEKLKATFINEIWHYLNFLHICKFVILCWNCCWIEQQYINIAWHDILYSILT